MSISPQRVGRLVWAFVYGGLFVIAIGAGLHRAGDPLGDVAIAVGVAAVLVGALLVWARSRMSDRGGPAA